MQIWRGRLFHQAKQLFSLDDDSDLVTDIPKRCFPTISPLVFHLANTEKQWVHTVERQLKITWVFLFFTNLSHLIVHQAQNIFILALASLSAVRKLCELYLVEAAKSADGKKTPSMWSIPRATNERLLFPFLHLCNSWYC